jgi:hypothetical protein
MAVGLGEGLCIRATQLFVLSKLEVCLGSGLKYDVALKALKFAVIMAVHSHKFAGGSLMLFIL